MATPRLLSLIKAVEGGPRADEVDLGKNMKTINNGNTIYNVSLN